MDSREFDDFIKSKVGHYEADVPTELWAKIERNIPSPAPVAPWRNIWRYSAVAATVLSGVLMASIWLYRHTPNTPEATLADQMEVVQAVAPILPITPLPSQPLVAQSVVANPYQTLKQVSEHTITTSSAQQSTPSSGVVLELQSSSTPQRTKQDGVVASVVQRERSQNLYSHNSKVQKSHKKGGKSKDRGLSLSLVVANTLSASDKSSGATLLSNTPHVLGGLSLTRSQDPELYYNHQMPINLGFTLSKEITSKWSLSTGIVYSLHHSTLHSEYKEGEQTLHYMGIPLNVSYNITKWGSGWNLYLTMGGEVDFNIAGRCSFSNIESGLTDNVTQEVIDNKPQWSLQSRVGLSYSLNTNFSLYLEPGFAYYLDNGNEQINNSWKEDRTNMTMLAGLRSNF